MVREEVRVQRVHFIYQDQNRGWFFFLFLVSPEHAPACTSRAVDIIMYSPYDLSHIKYGLYQPRGQQLRTKGWHWLSWPQQSGSQLGGCTGCRPWRNLPHFPSLLCHGEMSSLSEQTLSCSPLYSWNLAQSWVHSCSSTNDGQMCKMAIFRKI